MTNRPCFPVSDDRGAWSGLSNPRVPGARRGGACVDRSAGLALHAVAAEGLVEHLPRHHAIMAEPAIVLPHLPVDQPVDQFTGKDWPGLEGMATSAAGVGIPFDTGSRSP